MTAKENPISPIDAAMAACRDCQNAEHMMAACGAYEQAAKVRDAREELEACSIRSIANLRPEDASDYKPETLRDRMERQRKPEEPQP